MTLDQTSRISLFFIRPSLGYRQVEGRKWRGSPRIHHHSVVNSTSTSYLTSHSHPHLKTITAKFTNFRDNIYFEKQYKFK